ncbi:MAG: DUF58 domain-containing protein [Vibrio sp.]
MDDSKVSRTNSAPQPKLNPLDDPRVHCRYEQLVALKAKAGQLHLPSLLKAQSVLSGRHVSRFRGRGLNFEELRHYQQGDDIRNLDWKVTMRTGKPHVRAYTEEKDHNVMICVDQRCSMFFSSVDTMKSVVAAELAALLGWIVLKQSDRVGFALFNNTDFITTKPKRSQGDLLMALQRLSQLNQELSSDVAANQSQDINQVFERIMATRPKNTMIIILSDFFLIDQQGIEKLKYLQQHNNLLSIMITDPMEKSFDLADGEQWVISDGLYQFNIDTKHNAQAVNQELSSRYNTKQNQLVQLMHANHLPLIEVSTDGQHLAELERAFGGHK